MWNSSGFRRAGRSKEWVRFRIDGSELIGASARSTSSQAFENVVGNLQIPTPGSDGEVGLGVPVVVGSAGCNQIELSREVLETLSLFVGVATVDRFDSSEAGVSQFTHRGAQILWAQSERQGVGQDAHCSRLGCEIGH